MSANIVAIMLSVVALGISTWLAIRQAMLQKKATHLPAYLGLLSEFRSREFNDRYLYVCEKLAKEHDPKSGISGLPDDAREAIYDIAYYYQIFVTLILARIVDEDSALPFLQGRIIAVWKAISPYVSREREINSATGPYLLSILENFAMHAEQLPPESLSAVLAHRRWGRKEDREP
jgi:hypothetical protein